MSDAVLKKNIKQGNAKESKNDIKHGSSGTESDSSSDDDGSSSKNFENESLTPTIISKKEKKQFSLDIENVSKTTKRQIIFDFFHTKLSKEEIVQLFLRKQPNGMQGGFLKVATLEAFDKALKLDGSFIDGNHIKVKATNSQEKRKLEEDDDEEIQKSEVKKNKNVTEETIIDIEEENELEKFSVFMGNLDHVATDEQVRTFIESIVAPEEIVNFFRARFKDNKPKGYAFVELTTEQALKKVLKLNGSKLMGRHVRINLDNKRRIEKDQKDEKPLKKQKINNLKPEMKIDANSLSMEELLAIAKQHYKGFKKKSKHTK